MINNVILHNPRCSKSRQTLKLLEDANIKLDIIEYLKDTPSLEELDYICRLLGVEPQMIIRVNEKLFTELGLSLNDKQKTRKQWLQILKDYPKLIERPIVIYKNNAIISRPPERVYNIIDI